MPTVKQSGKKNAATKKEKSTSLSSVIERNIRVLINHRIRHAEQRNLQDRIADSMTSFSGRMLFVYIHLVWFLAWVILNAGWFGLKPFDPFPYGLLTMIVSLESIILSAFLLISQNRSRLDDQEQADLDMHISLLTEHELTQALQMLDEIQNKLGIRNTDKKELMDLEKETRPEDVLAEINRLQQLIK